MAIEQSYIRRSSCCLAKEHVENMETPSTGALLFVTFNKRLFARVRRVASTVNEFCALMPISWFLSHYRFVANRAVVHARSQSFLGRNVLFSAHRYNFSVNICKRLSSFDNLVKSFVHNPIDDNMCCFANLLYETIMIRERRLYLNDSVLLTGDVNGIIHYVCTS